MTGGEGRVPQAGCDGTQKRVKNAMWKRHALQLFKTDICKFFLQGRCLNGEACSYAHNFDEVRRKPDLTRTSMCPTVAAGGTCKNPACRFAHEDGQLRATHGFFKMKMCGFAASGKCKNGDACRFAHSLEELRPLEPPPPNAEEMVLGCNQVASPPARHFPQVPPPPAPCPPQQQQRQQQCQRIARPERPPAAAYGDAQFSAMPGMMAPHLEQYPGGLPLQRSAPMPDGLQRQQAGSGMEQGSGTDGSGGSDAGNSRGDSIKASGNDTSGCAATASISENCGNISSGGDQTNGWESPKPPPQTCHESDSSQSAHSHETNGSDNAHRSSRSPGSSSWAWADPADSNATDQSGDVPMSQHDGSVRLSSAPQTNSSGGSADAPNSGGGSSSGSGGEGHTSGQKTASTTAGSNVEREQRARRQEAMQGRREKRQQAAAEAEDAPQEKVTTLLITNIAPYFTQGALLSMFEDLTYAMRGNFDFFYLPWDEVNGHNFGTATINFPEADHAAAFQQIWQNKELCKGGRGQKALKLVKAQMQGLKANIDYYSQLESARCAEARFRPLYRDPKGMLMPLPGRVNKPPPPTAYDDVDVPVMPARPKPVLPTMQSSQIMEGMQMPTLGMDAKSRLLGDATWEMSGGATSTASTLSQDTCSGANLISDPRRVLHQLAQGQLGPQGQRRPPRENRIQRGREERVPRSFPNVMRREALNRPRPMPDGGDFPERHNHQVVMQDSMDFAPMNMMHYGSTDEDLGPQPLRAYARNVDMNNYPVNGPRAGGMRDMQAYQANAAAPMDMKSFQGVNGDLADFQCSPDMMAMPCSRPCVATGGLVYPVRAQDMRLGGAFATPASAPPPRAMQFDDYLPNMLLPREAGGLLHPSAFMPDPSGYVMPEGANYQQQGYGRQMPGMGGWTQDTDDGTFVTGWTQDTDDGAYTD